MNTLFNIFKDSFVLKIFIGVIAFIFSYVINAEDKDDKNIDIKTEYTLLDVALEKKIMELDNAYFEAYTKTIE